MYSITSTMEPVKFNTGGQRPIVNQRQQQPANVPQEREARNWVQAIYNRLPEGIVLGFALAPVPSLILAFMLARGWPTMLGAATMIIGGTILGIFCGVIWGVSRATWETLILPWYKQYRDA